jgi:hypothetical protein
MCKTNKYLNSTILSIWLFPQVREPEFVRFVRFVKTGGRLKKIYFFPKGKSGVYRKHRC